MLETQSVRRTAIPAVLATPEECRFECAFVCDFDCAGATGEIERNLAGVLQVTRICFRVAEAGDNGLSRAS